MDNESQCKESVWPATKPRRRCLDHAGDCSQNKERLESLRAEILDFLEDPQIVGTVDEFYGCKETYSGLWMSCEGGNIMPDGSPAFLPTHLVDRGPYEFHIHSEFQKMLDRYNAGVEHRDAGTVMIYLDY